MVVGSDDSRLPRWCIYGNKQGKENRAYNLREEKGRQVMYGRREDGGCRLYNLLYRYRLKEEKHANVANKTKSLSQEYWECVHGLGYV